MSCRRERFALGLVGQRISPFLGGKDQQGKQNLVSMEAPLLAFSFQLLKVITWFLFISEGPHPVGLWGPLVEVGPLSHTRLFSGSLVAFLFPSFLQIINSQAAVSTFWWLLLIKVQQSKGLDPGESRIHWKAEEICPEMEGRISSLSGHRRLDQDTHIHTWQGHWPIQHLLIWIFDAPLWATSELQPAWAVLITQPAATIS